MSPMDPAQSARESLSALFDGELAGDAARFTLKRLGQDPQWRRACGDWQLAGDVLRGRAGTTAPPDFAARVHAGLADETAARPGATNSDASGRRPRQRWFGGAALAASVALAAWWVSPFDQSAPDADLAPLTIATTQEAPPSAPPARVAARAAAPDSTLAAAESSRTERASQREPRASRPPTVLRAPRPPAATLAATASPVAPATAPDLGDELGDRLASDPFRVPAATPRAWPRAVLPGYPASGAFTTSYGRRADTAARSAAATESFYPFEPRLPPAPAIDAAASQRAPPR